MIITNKHGLPPAIYNACSVVFPLTPKGTYRASELVSPPQQYYLKRKHFDELEDDASKRLWAVLGSAPHYIFEKYAPEGSISEETLQIDFNGRTIKARADLIHGSELHDYKFTSVYSFLLSDKPEWEQQLNINAWVANLNGHMVTTLLIYAILRDWQESKSHDKDYPDIPFHEVEIPMWSRGRVEDWLTTKIAEFEAETPRQCTPEEMWERPRKYAVMKKGQKKAVKLLDSIISPEAIDYLASLSFPYSIVERPGDRIRCKSYCIVKDFCPQYKDFSQYEKLGE